MREQRKALIGRVTSDKMDKTIVVTVQRVSQHPLYGKVIKLNKKFQISDSSLCSGSREISISNHKCPLAIVYS